MAKKRGDRQVIALRSTESDHVCYMEKNKRNVPQRLELRRYDPTLPRHVLHRETRHGTAMKGKP